MKINAYLSYLSTLIVGLALAGCTSQSIKNFKSGISNEERATFFNAQSALPITRQALKEPRKLPSQTLSLSDAIATAAEQYPEGLITIASAQLENSVAPVLAANPIEEFNTEESHQAVLSTLSTADQNKIQALDLPLKTVVLSLLAAQQFAQSWISPENAVISQQLPECLKNLEYFFGERGRLDVKALRACDLPAKKVIEQADTKAHFIGAQVLIKMLLWAEASLKSLPKDHLEPGIILNITSDCGKVLILGNGESSLNVGDACLVIDLGGNDHYLQAAQATPLFSEGARNNSPITSLVLDLSGDDRYESDEEQTLGAISSYGGVSLLLDSSGNDSYKGDSFTQAFSFFGVSALIDRLGDDTYYASAFAQSVALSGISLLIDYSGKDLYQSIIRSQSSAGPRGVSLLYEATGNDKYELFSAPIIGASSQDPDHSLSLGQGTSWGIRGDLSDGASLAGGLAMLVEQQGNDIYNGDIFTQGTGFWLGTGCLIDKQGDDSYSGYWYAQGAGAHSAVGLLYDLSGNDHYELVKQSGQGMGHDLGLGELIDEAGNDDYTSGAIARGASNDGGEAVFIDGGGKDHYNRSAALEQKFNSPADPRRKKLDAHILVSE